MRFLANENFPLPSVIHLRTAGHEVTAVIEDMPGATDREVLAQATREARIVLTFDRDYGELIYRFGLPVPAGVVYFRFQPLTPTEPAERLLELLNMAAITLEHKFTTLRRTQVRQRALPQAGGNGTRGTADDPQ